MGIHRNEYYNTRTCPLNMHVLKISLPVTHVYPFTIFISYLVRVLSTDTREYIFFLHPYSCGINLVLQFFSLDFLLVSLDVPSKYTVDH